MAIKTICFTTSCINSRTCTYYTHPAVPNHHPNGSQLSHINRIRFSHIIYWLKIIYEFCRWLADTPQDCKNVADLPSKETLKSNEEMANRRNSISNLIKN